MKQPHIVVTGTENDCKELRKRIQEFGCLSVAIPTIRIRKRALSIASRKMLQKLEAYDYLLFTSQYAVRLFAEALRDQWIKRPQNIKIAAVGPATARALREVGISAHIIAKDTGAKALVRELRNVRGKRILFPRSAIAPRETIDALQNKGALVDVIHVYMTSILPVTASMLSRTFKDPVEQIVFLSPSGVNGFSKNLRGAILRKRILETPILAIGPTTARAARDAGFSKVIIAKPSTTDGIIETIRKNHDA